MVRRISSLQTKSCRRRHRAISSRNQLIFVITFFLGLQLKAQFSIGLYEGLMGNSGVALSDATAASYYNPSLLNRKKKDSYSLSGNTLAAFSSQAENTETTSFALNPGYLSTISVGDSLVHEFFIVNTSPSKYKIIVRSESDQQTIRNEQVRDQNQFIFGYSMAFKSIPFALSYFGEYSQIESNGFTEQTSLNSTLRSATSSKLNYKSLGLGVSVSGYLASEGGYTLGYAFRSRQLMLYKKDVTQNVSFVHGAVSASDYQRIETENTNQNRAPNGATIFIGHGFQVGDHEFITDSQFFETDDLIYKFNMYQTFGYKMNSSSGHQLLCGFSQQLGPEVRYLGQSSYYSVGYSWLKNTLRSVLGGYIYSSRLSQDVFAAGLTFGSEFTY